MKISTLDPKFKIVEVDFAGKPIDALLEASDRGCAVRVETDAGPGGGWPIIQVMGLRHQVDGLMKYWGFVEYEVVYDPTRPASDAGSELRRRFENLVEQLDFAGSAIDSMTADELDENELIIAALENIADPLHEIDATLH